MVTPVFRLRFPGGTPALYEDDLPVANTPQGLIEGNSPAAMLAADLVVAAAIETITPLLPTLSVAG